MDDVSGVSVLFFFFSAGREMGSLGVPSRSGYPVILAIRHHGARGRAEVKCLPCPAGGRELPGLAQSDRWRHRLYPIYVPIYIPLLSLPPSPPLFR